MVLDPGDLFERVLERVHDIDLDLDLDTRVGEALRARVADLRDTLRLTPTFTETRTVARDELRATMAEFRRAVEAHDEAALRPEDDPWRPFFVGEFKPAMIRAIQDTTAAQLRDDLDRAILVFRAMRSRCSTLRVVMGDFT